MTIMKDDIVISTANIQSNPASMSIGDFLPCRYTAPISGQVGTFSELGTTTATPIPVTASATPDGSFNFVYVDDDYKGRKVLVGDRNIQHSTSWDILNSSGIASGSGIYYKLPEQLTTIPKMTSNTSPFGIASASSEQGEAFKAFDRSIATTWMPYGITGWLMYDFGTGNSKTITKYSIFPHITQVSSCPKSWTFQGSNDNIIWITLDTKINQSGWINHYKDFQINNLNSYRYYKIDVTENNGDPSYLRIMQLRMTEESMPFNDLNFFLRLLTGGISSTDTDSEWHKYIVNSDLNGTITAGDNAIWNWSGIYSWSSNTPAITYDASTGRMITGNSSSTLTTAVLSSTVGNFGFRPVLIVETIKPLSPSNITATNLTYNSATLTWTPSENTTSYNIYDIDGNFVANTALTSFNLTGLTENTPYSYSVTAENDGGESLATPIVFLTLQLPPPTTPESLVSSNVTSKSVLLTWGASTGADSYNIYQDGILLINIIDTTYEVVNLLQNTLYNFTIKALNTTGESAGANIAIMTTPLPFITSFSGHQSGNQVTWTIDI